MKKILLLACLLALAAPILAQQNIILVIADDFGTDYCGFYEDAQDTANLPNIRSLLARGVRFRNAWSNPNCSPTRAGILTGRYAFRTGVGTAISGPEYAELDTSEITIGKLLKSAAPTAYATANIGKWHLNQQTQQSLIYPNLMGYDHYSGNFLGEIPNYYDWKKVTNGVGPTTVTNYATTETVDDAIAWLAGLDDSKPFFLWLAFNAPHTPYHKPPNALHTVPGLTGTQAHINQNPKKYFRAMAEAMDTETGRLFQWLSQQGLLDSTNVIFIGDNGNQKRVSQIADTTRGKGTIYEYGVHVPLVVAGPAVEAPGRSSDALASTPDLFATILEMAGFQDWASAIPASQSIDSESLMPILKNEVEAVRDWIFTEQFNPAPDLDDGKAIRNLDFKLLDFDDGHQEFYHLATDPLEQTDLLLLPSLDPVAGSNYQYLCEALSALVGSNACDIESSTRPTADAGGWALWPNPTNGLFYLETGISMPTEMTVWDLLGRQVAQSRSESSRLQLDISGLPAGRYLVRMHQAGNVWVGGVVKN